MNNTSRKHIDELISNLNRLSEELESLRQAYADKLEELKDGFKIDVEDVRDEEQEYFDNMPESLQNSEKGEAAQSAIDALENAASSIDQFDEPESIDLDEVVAYLEEAKGN